MTATVTINDKSWLVSVASTYAELTTGLKGITSIPADSGMLFVLPCDQAVTVTTVGCLFPIDIVFISSGLDVVSIAEGISPGLLISQGAAVRYFLEVNAGEAEGIGSGEAVHIEFAQPAATEAAPISTVASFAGVMMTGVMLALLGRTMAGAMSGKTQGVITTGQRSLRKEDELEFLADSPEFLAYTIDDIGYRQRLDGAFAEAIARAKGGR